MCNIFRVVCSFHNCYESPRKLYLLSIEFGDDLELKKREDVFLKKDKKLEDIYEVQEKLGEYVVFVFVSNDCLYLGY